MAQFSNSHALAFTTLCPSQGAFEAARIGGRPQQMGCLEQAGEFIGGNKGDILPASPPHHHDFAIVDYPVQCAGKIVAERAECSFDSHGQPQLYCSGVNYFSPVPSSVSKW